jgi:hypothetical protein
MGSDDYLDNALNTSKGRVGLFQFKLLFFVGVTSFSCYEPIMMNFAAYDMDFVCKVPELENLTFGVMHDL